jgi:hypothetical protein
MVRVTGWRRVTGCVLQGEEGNRVTGLQGYRVSGKGRG